MTRGIVMCDEGIIPLKVLWYLTQIFSGGMFRVLVREEFSSVSVLVIFLLFYD